MKLIVFLKIFICFFLQIPIANAASFDCTKSRTLVEKVICEAEEISILDDEMAENYFKIKNSLRGEEKRRFVDSQKSFLYTRNNCQLGTDKKLTVHKVFSVRNCLKDVYKKRIEKLIKISTAMSHPDNKRSTRLAISDEPKCPNVDGIIFLGITGGDFVMGDSDGYYSDEKPQHKITVDNFCISKFPLENIPMTFTQAVEYAKKLSDKYNTKIRLITESEWEYVASFGINPNKYGVKGLMTDWELTSTIYTKYPYRKNDGRENLSKLDAFRVLRGGEPYDPPIEYEPRITLRGYAGSSTPYQIRLAADPLK